MINAYYNGEFTSTERVKIPLSDRAVFFGDGVYDAAIGRNGKIYMEEAHIERFLRNAREMDIPLPLCREELTDALHTIAECAPTEGFFLYFQLTRYGQERKHSYPDTEKSNLLITATPFIPKAPDVTLTLDEDEDIRYLMCNVKTLNLLPAVLASKKAERNGCDECVFHRGETVTECAHSNIHIVKGGEIISHPRDCHILPGTAGKRLFELAAEMGIPVTERPFSLSELKFADEVLVTSSSKLCLRAKQFCGVKYRTDSRSVGLALCERMAEDFHKNTEKDC